ncbi:hypothetical protein SCP_1503470 [Sparassis crispa]|uniref:Uncharacterized protein n=1 Tax=Sparassis crispa TaxID=139825 RepID=A0A401H4N6_9APHY|nr:hypothetical protein SCP_1503470 [Sparassis crispa]GBE89339.1 hypothetical protein SCP_1503470 [Sparassis crispa]
MSSMVFCMLPTKYLYAIYEYRHPGSPPTPRSPGHPVTRSPSTPRTPRHPVTLDTSNTSGDSIKGR